MTGLAEFGPIFCYFYLIVLLGCSFYDLLQLFF